MKPEELNKKEKRDSIFTVATKRLLISPQKKGGEKWRKPD